MSSGLTQKHLRIIFMERLKTNAKALSQRNLRINCQLQIHLHLRIKFQIPERKNNILSHPKENLKRKIRRKIKEKWEKLRSVKRFGIPLMTIEYPCPITQYENFRYLRGLRTRYKQIQTFTNITAQTKNYNKRDYCVERCNCSQWKNYTKQSWCTYQ